MPLRPTLPTQGAFNKSIRQEELDMNNAVALPSSGPSCISVCGGPQPSRESREGRGKLLILKAQG